MLRLPIYLITPCVLAFVMVSARAAEPGPLNAALQSVVDKHLVAGAVGFVADKDHVLDLEAAGYSNLTAKTPMRTDSLFWIASMTKSLTGTALMMLVDEGKVSLDDPVEKYLPEFKGQMVAGDKDQPPHPPKHPITVREIMDHTSGLIRASDKSLKHPPTLKEFVAEIASHPLLQEPGTKFAYNNCGIDTGGRIIEVVSGIPYAQFMQQRLLTPLEMKDSTFWPDATLAKRLAYSSKVTDDKTGLRDVTMNNEGLPKIIAKFGNGHDVPSQILDNFGGGIIPQYGNQYAEPAGSLFSTASDVGRFCQMLLNGGTWNGKRYLSEAAIKQMSAVQTGTIPVNPEEGYGVGWFVKIKDDEGPAVGSYGHRGARKTCMWIDPTHQIVMVLMVQCWDSLPGTDKELYKTFFKTAVEKFGKKN
jgi:CubicO group peptidase (beta-lactamase class C family)